VLVGFHKTQKRTAPPETASIEHAFLAISYTYLNVCADIQDSNNAADGGKDNGIGNDVGTKSV
jgi:hypothetical protein